MENSVELRVRDVERIVVSLEVGNVVEDKRESVIDELLQEASFGVQADDVEPGPRCLILSVATELAPANWRKNSPEMRRGETSEVGGALISIVLVLTSGLDHAHGDGGRQGRWPVRSARASVAD
jgi:hypothetical protein